MSCKYVNMGKTVQTMPLCRVQGREKQSPNPEWVRKYQNQGNKIRKNYKYSERTRILKLVQKNIPSFRYQI